MVTQMFPWMANLGWYALYAAAGFAGLWVLSKIVWLVKFWRTAK